jgi:hypothetical protein
MYNPQVEELEPRQVLNGAKPFPQPPPPQPFPEADRLALVLQRAPILGFGGDHSGPDRPEWLREGGREVASARMMMALAFEQFSGQRAGIANDIFVEAAFAKAAARVLRLGLLEMAGTNRGAAIPAESDSGSAAEVPGPPTPARPENQASIPGVRLDGQPPNGAATLTSLTTSASLPGLPGAGQGLVLPRSGVWAGREGEAVSWVSDASLPDGPRDTGPSVGGRAARPPAVARGAAGTEEGAALPSPPGFGALDFLPPVPLAAVEAGMRRFLEQLEQVGQGLAGDQDEGGLGAWIAAGAAAAAACEIARRQLRRTAEVPSLARNRLPGPPQILP